MRQTMPRTAADRRAALWIAVLAAALLALFLASFVLGRYDVPIGQVVRILLSRVIPLTQTWTGNMEIAVLNLRLPRILLACLVGCSLSAAGTAYQSVFRNPMAAPDILGASSGACFGAALAILLGFQRLGVTAAAFAASLATVALVYVLARGIRGNQVVNLLLAGIMISSLFSAGTSYIKLVADPTNQLPAITYWLMGSLSSIKDKDVVFLAIPVALGMIPLFFLRWRMNLLTVGEEEAQSMGVNTRRLRGAVIVCATLLTSASVAVSGMIGWVGLVIPHFCRMLFGYDYRRLIPAGALFGAAFLLAVDDIARLVTTGELPLGILTAFVGAPLFLYLIATGGGRRVH